MSNEGTKVHNARHTVVIKYAAKYLLHEIAMVYRTIQLHRTSRSVQATFVRQTRAQTEKNTCQHKASERPDNLWLMINKYCDITRLTNKRGKFSNLQLDQEHSVVTILLRCQ